MPPRGSTTNAANPIRLPPLRNLKVRRPNRVEANPCMGIMTSMLGCWASAGKNAPQNCAGLEQKLRACMDAKGNLQPKKNNINSHLSRLYPKIVGPRKRD